MWENGISFRYTPDLGAFDWLNHPGPLAITKAEIWTSWKFSTVFLGEVTDRPLFPCVFSPYTILGSLKYHSKLTSMMPFYRGLGQVRVKTEERTHSLPPFGMWVALWNLPKSFWLHNFPCWFWNFPGSSWFLIYLFLWLYFLMCFFYQNFQHC